MTASIFQPPFPDPGIFDISAWPVVFARFPELDEHDRVDRVLDSLQAVLNQQQRFVIIWGMPRHDHDDEPHEDEKRSVIWLKQHRQELRRLCAGYVYVTQDPELRALLEARFPVVEKFLSFPKVVTDDRTQAGEIARGMLAS
ncbi:MAG: hypothetical protein QM581_14745 [Pseudomonas sp.]